MPVYHYNTFNNSPTQQILGEMNLNHITQKFKLLLMDYSDAHMQYFFGMRLFTSFKICYNLV